MKRDQNQRKEITITGSSKASPRVEGGLWTTLHVTEGMESLIIRVRGRSSNKHQQTVKKILT